MTDSGHDGPVATGAVLVDEVLDTLDRAGLGAVLALDRAAVRPVEPPAVAPRAPSDRWYGLLSGETGRWAPGSVVDRAAADRLLVAAAALLVTEAAELDDDAPEADTATAAACAAAQTLLAAAGRGDPAPGASAAPDDRSWTAGEGDPEREPRGIARAEMPDGALARQIAPPLRLLPFVRGRADFVTRLARLLDDPDGRIHVLVGPAGAGKTVVALALARLAGERSLPAWWVSAAETTQLMRDMVSVASDLGAPVAERGAILRSSPGPGADLLWGRLARATSPWLLVFDNADDPGLLGLGSVAPVSGAVWARPCTAGTVLVTARDGSAHDWGPDAVLHPVTDLEVTAGADVLLDAMELPETQREVHAAAARELAALLGGVPLALRGAGRYLGSSVARHTVGSLATALGRPVATYGVAAPPAVRLGPAWRIALDALDRGGVPQARPLLGMLSYCAPERTVADAVVTGERLAACGLGGGTAAEWTAALEGLVGVGLVARTVTVGHRKTGITVHPLVAEAARAEITGRDGVEAAAVRLLRLEADRREPGLPDDWPPLHRLGPHVSSVVEHMRTRHWQTHADALQLAVRVAESLVRAGLFAVAEELVRQAQDRAAGRLEPDNVSLLSSERTIAWALGHRGCIAEAEERFRNLLRILMDKQGPNDRATLAVRYWLAWILAEQGALAEARQMLFELQPVQQRLLGTRDPATMATRHLLAWIDALLGHLESAEINLRSVLTDRLAVLGPTHMDVFGTRYRLAWVLGMRRRTRQAETRFRRLAADIAAVLGEEHPTTQMARSRVAWALALQGRLGEAAEGYRSVVDVRERVLGETHPRTMEARNFLAGVLGELGHHDEAETLLRSVFAHRSQHYGPRNVRTLGTRVQLAVVRGDRGRLAEAEGRLRRLVGEAHAAGLQGNPRVLGARHQHGIVLLRLGRLSGAEQLLVELLIDQQRVFGPMHRDVLATRDLLATVLATRGLLAEAVVQHRHVLSDRQRLLGTDDPDTLRSVGHLATALADQGHLDEARDLYARLGTLRRRLLEPAHPDVFETGYREAWLAHLSGRPRDAAAGYAAVLRDQEAALPAEHPHVMRTRAGLARALLDAGDVDAAGTTARALHADQVRLLGAEHPDTLHTAVGIALVAAAEGATDAAVEDLQKLARTIEQTLDRSHPLALSTVEHLGWLLAADRPDDAEQLWVKVESRCCGVIDADHPTALRLAGRVADPAAVGRPPLV